MKTVLELFLVTRVPKNDFHVVRKSLDLTQEARDPDQVADEYIKFLFSNVSLIADREKYILHSTSWRYEAPRTIVLTYLVYADSFSLTGLNPYLLKLDDLRIAATENPQIPRPKNLTQHSVISHGIRHLAFLIATDEKNVYRKIISNETCAAFMNIDQSLAGRIN